MEPYQPLKGYRPPWNPPEGHRVVRRAVIPPVSNPALLSHLERDCSCGAYLDAYAPPEGLPNTQENVDALLDDSDARFHRHLMEYVQGIRPAPNGGIRRVY